MLVLSELKKWNSILFLVESDKQRRSFTIVLTDFASLGLQSAARLHLIQLAFEHLASRLLPFQQRDQVLTEGAVLVRRHALFVIVVRVRMLLIELVRLLVMRDLFFVELRHSGADILARVALDQFAVLVPLEFALQKVDISLDLGIAILPIARSPIARVLLEHVPFMARSGCRLQL